MSATEFRETAQPAAQPGSATGETLVLSVEAAAELLGISPQAVRKRIHAGTLAARREGRAWLVYLERVGDSATSATETSETGAQPRPKRAQPERNLVAHQQAEQWAAMIAPFFVRLEALTARAVAAEIKAEDAEERAAALELAADVATSRAAEAERERDELRARLAEVTNRQDAPVSDPTAPGREMPPDMTPTTLQADAADQRSHVARLLGRLLGRRAP